MKALIAAATCAVLLGMSGCQLGLVKGASMAPTLENADHLLVNKFVYRLVSPRQGDIIALRYPIKPEQVLVKRVIAGASDTVRIKDGRVFVNDRPIGDDYVPAVYRSHDDWGPQRIPQGCFFVMGDHRNRSWDSRHWGVVRRGDIVGKVEVRWWPPRLF